VRLNGGLVSRSWLGSEGFEFIGGHRRLEHAGSFERLKRIDGLQPEDLCRAPTMLQKKCRRPTERRCQRDNGNGQGGRGGKTGGAG
jgi:hypothetical protein